MRRIHISDILLWGLTTSVFWLMAGVVTAALFYTNESGSPDPSTAPERMMLFKYVLIAWTATGLVIGIIALFRFLALSAMHGPVQAYPIHSLQICFAAMIIGCMTGMLLYPYLPRPDGVVLKPMLLRIMISGGVAFIATAASLRTIGIIGRLEIQIKSK